MGKAVSTKEKILEVSIRLFAQKGFKEVTVREIADAVGIRASSLYKHYESKDDILGSIFGLFREKIAQTELPDLPEYVRAVSPEEYLAESFALFAQVMWSPTIVKIARIIALEQQRDPSIRRFFREEFIEKPLQAMRHVFDLMADSGQIDAADTGVLAEEYTAFILWLFFEQHFVNETPSLEEIREKMARHNRFFAQYILKKGGD